MTVTAPREVLERRYGWALSIDFDAPENVARFWYVREEKLAPRLGERATEEGATLEQPLCIAPLAAELYAALRERDPNEPVATLLLAHPEHRCLVTARAGSRGPPLCRGAGLPDRRRHASPSTSCAASSPSPARLGSIRDPTAGSGSISSRARPSLTRSRNDRRSRRPDARRLHFVHRRIGAHRYVARRGRNPVHGGRARHRHGLAARRGGGLRRRSACRARGRRAGPPPGASDGRAGPGMGQSLSCRGDETLDRPAGARTLLDRARRDALRPRRPARGPDGRLRAPDRLRRSHRAPVALPGRHRGGGGRHAFASHGTGARRPLMPTPRSWIRPPGRSVSGSRLTSASPAMRAASRRRTR